MAYKIVEEFYPIMFAQKKLLEEYTHGYKVFSDKNSYVIVDAIVVSDAIEKSDIKEPYKIQKVRQSVGSILRPSTLSSAKDTIPPEESAEIIQNAEPSEPTKSPPSPTDETTAKPNPEETTQPATSESTNSEPDTENPEIPAETSE